MEILEEKLKKFLDVSDGYGSGYGDGDGYGSGYGYGYGYGSGSGYGYGSGSGDGDGSGSGSGDGDGSGYGDGDGSGSGSGSGYGYGDGYGYGENVSEFNNNKVYKIDAVNTIIKTIVKNVAKGFILNNDFTLEETYVVKNGKYFAHGKTIKEAQKSLQEKIISDMDIEERIEQFCNKFNNKSKYKGTTFFEWHHILTGSCLQGRENFVRNHNLDLNKMYSVKEFIDLTENDYNGEIIKQLKEYYKVVE